MGSGGVTDERPSVKATILEALVAEKGYVSGESLSLRTGVSRSAVWKHIEALRQDGYSIEALPHHGYRLVGRPDRAYPWEVSRHLHTRRLGRELRYYPQIGSTNDVAVQLAAEGAPEGLVVVAEQQTAGRGRRGRTWFSPPDSGLWFSLLLRPSLHPLVAPRLTLLAAVAGAQAIRALTGAAVGIKWPNDLLMELKPREVGGSCLPGKKVAGILLEMSAVMDTVQHVVVGVGINVHVRPHEFPADLREVATSVDAAAGCSVDRAALLARFLDEFEPRYDLVQAEGFTAVVDEARGLSVILGRRVQVLEGERTWVGQAQDISEDGALILRLPDGSLRSFYAGEVSLRTPGEV